MNSERIGDWFLTYTGKQFYPLDPRPEDICIEDIAHALANTCRFGGHCALMYSVAQHSVIVSKHCPDEAKLEGLLHDATEAYLGDMVRPLKYMMPAYLEAEQRMWRVVAEAFGVPFELHPSVKIHDNRALVTERRDLLHPGGPRWQLERDFTPYDEYVFPWSPRDAESIFLGTFHDLTGGATENQAA